MKISVWTVKVLLLIQLAQVVVGYGLGDYIEQLQRFGLECVLKGNDTFGQLTSHQIAEQTEEINRGINSCFGRLDFQQLSRQFEHELEESELERTEENELKLRYKLVCKVTSQVLECLESFENRLKECKHTPALAILSLIRTSCKGDGNAIYGLEQIGKQCAENNDDEKLGACLAAVFPQDVSDKEAYVLNNLCKVSTQTKDCLTDAAYACENGKYKGQIDAFLGDLKSQSPAAAECFFSQ